MFSKSLDAGDVVNVAVSQIERAVPFTTCVVYLKAQDGGSLSAAYAFGRNADRIQGKTLGMGQGIAGWVIINGRHMCNTDPMLDLERFLAVNEDDYRTNAVFPLSMGDETMGAIALYAADLDSYHSGHIQLLESASRLTSTALHHALLNEQARAGSQFDLLSGPTSGPLRASV